MRNTQTRQLSSGALLLLVFSLVMTSACSALGVVNATSPSGHYQKNADISYGPAPRQQLDVYYPINVADDAPTVFFLYGGGWREGQRQDYEFVASALTESGFRVVIPDYRLYPSVQFPTFVEDAAEAVRWTHQHLLAQRSSGSLYIAGHSAGAHIAALLVSDTRYLDSVGLDPRDFSGFIGLSGPYDFLPIDSGYLLDVFPAATRSDSQPIVFVGPQVPSTLLIHGQDDEVVMPENSQRFGQALEAEGVSVEVLLYEGTGHAAVAAALAPNLTFVANTLGDVVSFINTLENRPAPK